MHTTMNVTGRPAQFGRGVMVEVGGKLVDKFAENLAQYITDGNGTSADSSAANGSASTQASADTEANGAAVESDGRDAGAGRLSAVPEAGSGTAAQPAAAQPAAAQPAAVTSAATAPPAHTSEDSLNLVRLVGPAVLKRLIPVAVAAVAIVLLGRQFRHLLRRGEHGQKA
jgi:hypothetical protein